MLSRGLDRGEGSEGGMTDGVSGTQFSATVSRIEGAPLAPRAGVLRPERNVMSSFSAMDLAAAMERSGAEADALF